MNREKSVLRAALLEAADREFSALPDRKALEGLYPFSPRFEAGMAALVRKTNRRYVQIGRRMFRRAAAAAAALLLLLCGCMAVPAVRSLVVETFQGFSSFWFPMDEAYPAPAGMGMMSMIFPEGYHMKEMGPMLRVRQVILETDNGEELDFVQAARGMTLLLGDEDAEDSMTEACVLGGHAAVKHSAGGVNTIVWTVGEYAYRIRGSCEMEVLERFVEQYEPDLD